MKISNRLRALYDAVSLGESVADIGTDHGYVPILLLQNHVSPKVILSDISSGSLAKAIENFHDVPFEIPESCFRVGDGLNTLQNAEVETVIIAGMGGQLIESILEENPEKTASYRKFILQPRNNSGELRCYLYENGFDIEQEILVDEGKFICEIIVATPGKHDYRLTHYDKHDIRWKYPEAFIMCEPRLLAKRIDWRANRILEQIESLKRSQMSQESKIAELNAQREYILELKERNQQYHEEKDGNH
jgi:tRNA (adenine22-N1)-methyltransferase